MRILAAFLLFAPFGTSGSCSLAGEGAELGLEAGGAIGWLVREARQLTETGRVGRRPPREIAEAGTAWLGMSLARFRNNPGAMGELALAIASEPEAWGMVRDGWMADGLIQRPTRQRLTVIAGDNRYLVSIDVRGKVRVIDLKSNQVTASWIVYNRDHRNPLYGVSEDGELVLAKSGNSVCLYQARDGLRRASVPIQSVGEEWTGAGFVNEEEIFVVSAIRSPSATGIELKTSGADEGAVIRFLALDGVTQKRPKISLRSGSEVWGVSINEGNQRMLVVSADGYRLWDVGDEMEALNIVTVTNVGGAWVSRGGFVDPGTFWVQKETTLASELAFHTTRDGAEIATLKLAAFSDGDAFQNIYRSGVREATVRTHQGREITFSLGNFRILRQTGGSQEPDFILSATRREGRR